MYYHNVLKQTQVLRRTVLLFLMHSFLGVVKVISHVQNILNFPVILPQNLIEGVIVTQ